MPTKEQYAEELMKETGLVSDDDAGYVEDEISDDDAGVVGLPDESGSATSTIDTTPTKKVAKIRGGVTAPVESAQMAIGVAKGLAKGVADRIVRGDRKVEESRKRIAKNRESRLPDSATQLPSQFLQNVISDAEELTAGIGTLFYNSVAGFPVEEGKDLYEVGEELGTAIVPELEAGVTEAVTNPLETIVSAPVSSALTLVPGSKAATQLAKGVGVVKGAEKIAALTANKFPKLAAFAAKDVQLPAALSNLTNGLKKVTGLTDENRAKIGRFLTDPDISSNPTAVVLLDEIRTAIPQIEGAVDNFKNIVTQLDKERKLLRGADEVDDVIESTSVPVVGVKSVPVAEAMLQNSPNLAKALKKELVAPVVEEVKSLSGVGQTSTLVEYSPQLENAIKTFDSDISKYTDDINTLPIANDILASNLDNAVSALTTDKFKGQLGAIAKELNIDPNELANTLKSIGPISKLDINTVPEVYKEAIDKILNDVVTNREFRKEALMNVSDAIAGKQTQDTITKIVENSFLERSGFSTIDEAKNADMQTFATQLLKSDEVPAYIPLSTEKFNELRTMVSGISGGIESSGDKVINKLVDYVQQFPEEALAFLDSPDRTKKNAFLKQQLDEMVKVETPSFNGYVNPSVAGYFANETMVSEWPTVQYILNTLPKKIAVPLNFKSAVNNFVGNQILTSLYDGPLISFSPSNVVGLAQKYLGAQVKKRGILSSNVDDEFMEVAKKVGLFNNSQVFKEIQFADNLSKGIAGVPGLAKDAIDKATELIGNAPVIGPTTLQKFGDEMYKIPVALSEYKVTKGVIDSLKVDEYAQFALSPTVTAKIVKVEDGYQMSKLVNGKQVGQPTVLSNEDINTIIARHAKKTADDLYFDYGRVPGVVKQARSNVVIGAGSPFFTYAWKALDVPGVKRGIFSNIIASPNAVSTNSLMGNAILSASNARRAASRSSMLMWAAANDRIGGQPAEVERLFKYDMTNPVSPIIKETLDPYNYYVAAPNVIGTFADSAKVLGLLDTAIINILDMAGKDGRSKTAFTEKVNSLIDDMKWADSQMKRLQSIRNPTEDELAELADATLIKNKSEHELLTYRVANDIIKRKESIPLLMNLVGISGSMFFDEYVKMQESEKAGQVYDISDGLSNVFLPSWLKAAMLTQNQQKQYQLKFGSADKKTNEALLEDATRFWMRQLFGIGYRTVSTRKSYEKYVNSFEKELVARLEKWKAKKSVELMKRANRLYPDAETLKKLKELKETDKRLKKALQNFLRDERKRYLELSREKNKKFRRVP
jgi:hypothetical protein